MKIYKNRLNGFTLVEVLVTLAILAILAAIAYPMYTGYMTGSKRTEAKTNLQSLRLLIEQYYAENGKYCPDASCNSKTYTYTEDDSGTITAKPIIDGAANPPGYLLGFKPKSAASTNAVLYNYTLLTSATGTGYTMTAAPVASRGAPPTNLTLNQDGAKTGPW
jgi:prepilin-type N-terminal cleavage/methylation domain-containing protein